MSEFNLSHFGVKGVEGVVAVNSADYVRTVFSLFRRGRMVVPIRGPRDDGRITAAGIEHVTTPGAGVGWVQNPGYEHIDTGEIAQLSFTSGTEGEPKGILLSHAALANTTERLVDVMEMDADIREYVGVPVFHSFGFGRCRAVAHAGGQIYLPPSGFDPREVADLLRSGEINAVSAVPSLWRLVLARQPLFEGVGKRLRWLEVGSQYMQSDEKARLRALFPEACIVQHYGLTEASRTTFLRVDQAPDDGMESVGRPTGGVEVAIRSDRRILIRGPHLASGWLRGDRVEPIVDADSWLVTQDEGRMDDEGRLWYLGRADDLINCGGVKISPEQFERELAAALGVTGSLAVARIPDPIRGDGLLVAFLKGSGLDRSTVAASAVQALSDRGLSAGEALHIIETDRLQTTATGKLKRRAIAEQYLGKPRVETHPRETHGFDPPRDPVEEFLAERFGALFGIHSAGLDDSMLEHGADSLRAVELLSDIKLRYGVELPLASLSRSPTLRGVADSIRWAQAGHGAEEYRYLVPLAVATSDKSRPTLFVVGGSYGNVLHLHDFARTVSEAVDVYGVQYRGLLGDDMPRESLEEAAADYLEEVLDVRSHEPFFLCGYSGGGLIALEMARQLIERGSQIHGLSMIDTRLPAKPPYQEAFGMADRQRIRGIQARRRGEGITAIMLRILRASLRSLRELTSRPNDAEDVSEWSSLPPVRLRSERINRAFRRALARYRIPHLPLKVLVFRPADQPSWVLPSGMIDFVDVAVHRIDEGDNGWGAFFDSVEVHWSPGDHLNLAHGVNATSLGRLWLDAHGLGSKSANHVAETLPLMRGTTGDGNATGMRS